MTETPPLEPHPPRRRRRRLGRILLVLFLVGAMFAGGAVWYGLWAMGGTPNGEAVTVEVPAGASGGTIARLLEDKDVIRSSFMFRLVARLRGVGASLKPGVYELRIGLGVTDAIDLLERGIEPDLVRVSIPEGKTLIEIARIVGERTHISEQRFMRAARSGNRRIGLMPDGVDDLEGLLFPKTYDVGDEMGAGDLIDQMLGQFVSETRSIGLDRKARALGMTAYDAVIAASLIEREAKVQKDRPLVSSVIQNRLERGMRLQIDATVQYAILLQTGSYKDPLTQEDYTRVRSPYNTYLNDGMPPGPIAVPGLAALRAAVNPADTDYLFYRLTSDGRSHCFSETVEEHNSRCANA